MFSSLANLSLVKLTRQACTELHAYVRPVHLGHRLLLNKLQRLLLLNVFQKEMSTPMYYFNIILYKHIRLVNCLM